MLLAPLGTEAPQFNPDLPVGGTLRCSRGQWGSDFRGSFTYREPETVVTEWLRDSSHPAGTNPPTPS